MMRRLTSLCAVAATALLFAAPAWAGELKPQANPSDILAEERTLTAELADLLAATDADTTLPALHGAEKPLELAQRRGYSRGGYHPYYGSYYRGYYRAPPRPVYVPPRRTYYRPSYRYYSPRSGIYIGGPGVRIGIGF